MAKEIIVGEIYRHYRTQQDYKIIALAIHSETYEDMVVYQALYDCEKFGPNKIWTRPAKLFNEMVELDGAKVERFERKSLSLA